METLIIKPRDKAELNFFIELAKRLGVKTKTYDEIQDEQLLKAMEENKKTPTTEREKVINTLQNILNEEQPPYKNES
jgi:hypothetical protein